MPARRLDEREVARRAGLDPELDVAWADGHITGARYRRKPSRPALVERLAELPKLRRLGIHDVDEPFIRVIGGLTKVTMLHIPSAGVTDAAAPQLAGLIKLRPLALSAALRDLRRLEKLSLCGMKITPSATAECLCGLTNLELLFLPPSARSTPSQARLKQCLPKLQLLKYG